RSAVVGVTVVRLSGERIEPEGRVIAFESGQSTITVNLLRPAEASALIVERAVVLRATLEVVHVIVGNRNALELQRRETDIHAVDDWRYRTKQLLTKRKVGWSKISSCLASSALRRDIDEEISVSSAHNTA